MNPSEKINVTENEYYQIHYILSEESGKWLARIRITRKDTNEYIRGGFTVYGNEKNNVKEKTLTKINNLLIPKIEALGCPPEWDTEIRRILVECTKHRRAILKFGGYCHDCISTQIDDNVFGLEYAKFWQRLINATSILSKRVEQLSPQERINLLVSPDSVFEDPSDSWSLEDLDSRNMIYGYFANPSEQEKITHETQLKKLNDRFEELGWE